MTETSGEESRGRRDHHGARLKVAEAQIYLGLRGNHGDERVFCLVAFCSSSRSAARVCRVRRSLAMGAMGSTPAPEPAANIFPFVAYNVSIYSNCFASLQSFNMQPTLCSSKFQAYFVFVFLLAAAGTATSVNLRSTTAWMPQSSSQRQGGFYRPRK